MPKIEFVLPGNPRTTVEDIAGTYRITVERLDGIACSEMEARTILSMVCFHALKDQAKAGKKRQRSDPKAIRDMG